MKALHQDLAQALHKCKLHRRELATIRHVLESMEASNQWKIHWAIINEMRKEKKDVNPSSQQILF